MLRVVRAYRDLPPAVQRWLPYWLFAAGLFSVAGLLGAAVGTQRETALIVPVREAGDPVVVPTATELFAHNATLALLAAAGAVTFGIYTAWTLAYNGFALGGVVADATGTHGPVQTVLVLAPHGIVELPAIWLAGAIAFRWTHVLWAVANGRSRAVSVPRVALRSLAAVGLVLLSLALAAVVEAYVTGTIARVLTG